MTGECLFCRIVRGEVAVSLLAQNPYAVAFRDIQPQAPVHILVVPRRHVSSLVEDPDQAELGAMMMLAESVARAEDLAADGFRLVVNTGRNGGQTVQHLHLHVLGGRPMEWPPG